MSARTNTHPLASKAAPQVRGSAAAPFCIEAKPSTTSRQVAKAISTRKAMLVRVSSGRDAGDSGEIFMVLSHSSMGFMRAWGAMHRRSVAAWVG